ncbi:hypothetical protein Glo7428_0455 [Gloeocapsa sp. PCC 7428]|uniref:hypothetical protein n=1 Tax=Gloeocapsa sp. PCC 7428 TaxID=1173026 RepID=UPI0002A5DD1B|nr:hypothetical protein [Gloeocapsa sp. PCC 7428]AFZ29056.1 hypothetical protein Glo7428_0455 [Gloeocapsa sp. PCC 7428]
MMYFYHQPSKKTQSTCDNWTKYHKVAANVSRIVTLAALIGLGGEILGRYPAIAQTTQPISTTQAAPARMNLKVNRQPQESYESLMNRAETVAVTAVKQRFSQDRHTPAISVMIVADSYGAIAPVLSLEISRNEWHYSKAETKDQMKYFSTAKMLLGFDGVATNNTNQPQTTTTATPETTPEMEQIDRFIRESDNKPTAIPEEMPEGAGIEAPAIVPVETSTPELPTIIPGEASVPETSGALPSNNAILNPVPVNGATEPQPNNLNPNLPTFSPIPTNNDAPLGNIPANQN